MKNLLAAVLEKMAVLLNPSPKGEGFESKKQEITSPLSTNTLENQTDESSKTLLLGEKTLVITQKPSLKKTKKDKREMIRLAEEAGEEIGLSRQTMKLLSIAGEIRLDPDKTESAFMARQLVQATLPHKNPGDIEAWSRKNGDLTLTIRSGWDDKNNKKIGYPYGTLPRLLLFWITTEAVRTKNQRIELGKSLSKFMGDLGLDPYQGGKRSDIKRLRDQMNRLFRSTISFSQSTRGQSWIDMQVAPKGMLWWDDRKPQQDTLFENWIQLGEDFFKAITDSPVPVDMRILKALRRSPLALDFYMWASHVAYKTQLSGQSKSLSWKLLHEQFGAEYGDIKDFSKKSWAAILKIKAVYPDLAIERVRGGIKVLPSKPSITVKKKKITKG